MPLHLAANNNHLTVIEKLLAAGAAKDATNKVRGDGGGGGPGERRVATRISACHLCLRSCRKFRRSHLFTIQNNKFIIVLETCAGIVGVQSRSRTSCSRNVNT